MAGNTAAAIGAAGGRNPPGKPRAARPDDGPQARLKNLIAAAEDIFLAKGYHSATMSDVAAAAGMSKKTVYQLVASKGELFAALLAHYQERLVFPEPRPGWNQRDLLVETLYCLARFLLSAEPIAVIRLIMAEYTHGRDLGRLFHQSRVKRAKTHLQRCLRDTMLCGGLSAAESRELAAMLFGMAIGEYHLGVLIGFGPSPGPAALRRRISMAVDVFLAGVPAAARPARPRPQVQ